jgi:hypothetical protein
VYIVDYMRYLTNRWGVFLYRPCCARPAYYSCITRYAGILPRRG